MSKLVYRSKTGSTSVRIRSSRNKESEKEQSAAEEENALADEQLKDLSLAEENSNAEAAPLAVPVQDSATEDVSEPAKKEFKSLKALPKESPLPIDDIEGEPQDVDVTEKITVSEEVKPVEEVKPAAEKKSRKPRVVLGGNSSRKNKAVEEEIEDTAEEPTPSVDRVAQIAAEDEAAATSAIAEDSVRNTLDASNVGRQSEYTFDKDKIVKYFKRHPKMVINTKVDRFTPELPEGLNPEQVQTRFEQYLFNDTNKKYSKSYASIFIGNICTFFNLLCLIAFIMLLLAGVQGITNYLVIVITTANIVIGIVQEIRSKLAIDKLAIMAKSLTKVIRDGETIEIPTSEIVLDDVIIMELGNQVPADCILAEGNVEVNESLLTGESVSIKKQIGDMLYAGSFIASGTGKCRVEKVGKETFLEKLTSKAKKYKRPHSELINSMHTIIKVVSILIVPIAIGVFFVTRRALSTTTLTPLDNGVFQAEGVKVLSNLFKPDIALSLAKMCSVVIGMIPSGMLLLTSVALAVGVVRLAKNNTLVRDLYSLEMLARVNVLCLDKTGTITDGRMTVSDTVILNTVGEYSLQDIMGSMLAALDDNNQTSIALYNHFGHNDILTPVTKIPFSSKRKLSAVTFEDVGTFVMGAPEFVLKPMPTKIEKIVKQYAQMGLRVIVLAHSATPIIGGEKLPNILKPIAVISIADNIREDAIETIKWFKDNGVQVKVISGDNPITVSEVAKRAGIENAEKFISLEGFNEKEVENVANKYTVFGRVTPEQKAILVRAIKTEGNTVAMTGDGVNDILALKEADCAISVASGSEAARNVSHLVLMDNNFCNMPKVVGEGRRVINNIKNSASLYLMKTLFTAILATLFIIMGEAYLFVPSNMLLLEVAIIGIPSFFLSLQPNNDRIEGKFISHVMNRSISGAAIMIICVMAMFLTCQFGGDEFTPFKHAMCMMGLTFSGLVMLYRVCQPINWYRLVLFILMTVICVVAMCIPFTANLLCDDWAELPWKYDKILIVAVAIEAAFPLSASFIKIMQVIMPSSVTTTKKSDRSKKKKTAGGDTAGQQGE